MMTITIDIPAESHERMKSEAQRLGLHEAEYARRLIEQQLASATALPTPDRATAAGC